MTPRPHQFRAMVDERSTPNNATIRDRSRIVASPRSFPAVNEERMKESTSPRSAAATSFAVLVRSWPELVGVVVSQNTRPVALVHDGSLHVEAASRAWASELAALAADLLRRLPRRVDGVELHRICWHIAAASTRA